MIWHVKINNENTQIINIGYSYEENSSIDGVIELTKKRETSKLRVCQKDGVSLIPNVYFLIFGA